MARATLLLLVLVELLGFWLVYGYSYGAFHELNLRDGDRHYIGYHGHYHDPYGHKFGLRKYGRYGHNGIGDYHSIYDKLEKPYGDNYHHKHRYFKTPDYHKYSYYYDQE